MSGAEQDRIPDDVWVLFRCIDKVDAGISLLPYERYVLNKHAPIDIIEGVALQPATPAVCNAPENNMQS